MLRRRLAPLIAVAAAALLGLLVVAQSPPAAPTPAPAPTATCATSRPPSPGVTVTATPTAIRPIPDGFRVRVPRLRIDLPIAEGIIQRDVDLQQTPEGFAFHLPGTSIPGEIGNTYIYSHARVGMFLSLWDARVGDEVIVAAPDGRTLTYVVSEVRPRVAPSDISVAQPTSDERLTLQTSTGPSPGDPRSVVIALPRPQGGRPASRLRRDQRRQGPPPQRLPHHPEGRHPGGQGPSARRPRRRRPRGRGLAPAPPVLLGGRLSPPPSAAGGAVLYRSGPERTGTPLAAYVEMEHACGLSRS